MKVPVLTTSHTAEATALQCQYSTVQFKGSSPYCSAKEASQSGHVSVCSVSAHQRGTAVPLGHWKVFQYHI